MSDYATVMAAGTVRLERLLPAIAERVWPYFTDSARRATWLAAGPLEPRVGGRVDLHFDHATLSAEPTPPQWRPPPEGLVGHEQVTHYEPPHLLGLTWGAGAAGAGASAVTLALLTRGDQVLLVVTHRQLVTRTDMVLCASGWLAHTAILADQLAGVTPRPFWTTFEQARAVHEARFAPDAAG